MAYVTLYREWRPKTFADIVGQEHISKTLQNAIEAKRIAHAYLFCGPRGTGKTTTAKVLSKALNCLKSSATEPCNQCENCLRINEGTSYDVIEIDAASNRGIDEIRDLREKVKFAPAEGKFKIYIIDEVHMLTTEAFNALLKTLEEPPKHVIFILATTEPHKIPLTILSRCQRFDFRRINLQDTIERMKYIASCEQIDVTDDALRLIAKRAEGGMRDALSIFDQCISFSGKKITENDISSILGTINEEVLQKISESILKKDTTHCLQLVDENLKMGKDAKQFIKDLIEYFRNLMLVLVCDQVDGLVNVSENALNFLQSQAKQVRKDQILNIIDLLADAEKEMKWATQQKLMLEVGIIKAAQLEKDISVEHLSKRLDNIEESLASGQKIIKQSPAKKIDIDNNPVQNEVYQVETKVDYKKKTVSENNNENISAGETEEPALLTKIRESWNDVITSLKKEKKMSVSAFLQEGQPLSINNNTLLIGFKEGHGFHKEQIEKPENKVIVEKIIGKLAGKDLKIKGIVGGQSISHTDIAVKEGKDSLIEQAEKFFGKEVIEIND